MNGRLLPFALTALLALTACRRPVPPATPAPPAPSDTGYGKLPPATSSINVRGGAAQRFLTSFDVPGQWWSLFHSERLNALIEAALSANPDVAAAQASLRAARETFYAQHTSAYPNAQGSFSVSRQQVPTYLSPPTNNNSEYIYGVHTLSLDVGYTPDVFGNLRYQTASAAAAAAIERFQTEATYLTLTSNVVATVVQIASLREQITATNRIITIERKLLDLTKAERRFGQADGLDVATQEGAVRAAEQSLPPLRKQLLAGRDLLARLVGQPPSATPDSPFTLDTLHLPEALPLSLPSKLIDQRPDIAMASANLAQASAQVGVAYTNRLPNFDITAQLATQALTLGGLFGAGSTLSTLTGQVSQSFYDHGTLKHRERSAVAAYDEAAAQYQGAVLSGLQNVADSLAALTTDADALRSSVLADRTAHAALRIVEEQRRNGQVSALATLNAEQSVLQDDLSLIQAEAGRYADTAALFAALGGGWWNRHETTAKK